MARARIAATLWILAGCGGPAPRPQWNGMVFERGDERFQVRPPQRWDAVESPDSDVAWRDPGKGAVIAANATCRGHHDPPLSVLVNDLLIGTTSRHVLLGEDVSLDGRAARHEVIWLLVDGVPLIYDLYVMKKDGCVYDLSLVCRPRAYDSVADQFVAFVAGFHGLGKGVE